jgi:hypothetical protein
MDDASAAREAADHLRACADLDPAAMAIVSRALGITASPDRMRSLADGLDPAPPVDEGAAALFLEMTDGDGDAIVDSDVHGLKGSLALHDGRVVRVHGGFERPFEEGRQGLLDIMADGAYGTRGAA